MAVYGTAGNGSTYCCYEEDGAVGMQVYGTINDDILTIHDGTANREFRPADGAISAPDTFDIEVYGRGGDDIIESSNDQTPDVTWKLYGNIGHDTLTAYYSDDDAPSLTELHGETGNDTLQGSVGHDTLKGGGGTDTIYGGSGDDTINGGADADELWGQGGDDTIKGDEGADDLMGGDGDDHLLGGDGDDDVCGDDGADTLRGKTGNDNLYGDTSTTSDDGDSDDAHAGPTGDTDACHADTVTNCDTEDLDPYPCPT